MAIRSKYYSLGGQRARSVNVTDGIVEQLRTVVGLVGQQAEIEAPLEYSKVTHLLLLLMLLLLFKASNCSQIKVWQKLKLNYNNQEM